MSDQLSASPLTSLFSRWLDASDQRMIAIAVLMLVAGVFGSWCRALLEPQDRAIGFNEVVVPGVVAAFIVPLFLSLGKSDIYGSTLAGKDFYPNLLVIFGFCLLAAFSAKSFVNALASKALEAAQRAEAKADVAVAESQISAEIASETAEPASTNTPSVDQDDEAKLLARATTQNERLVLKAILAHPGKARSRASIASETGLSQAATLIALTSLVGINVINARKSQNTDATLFRLGPTG